VRGQFSNILWTISLVGLLIGGAFALPGMIADLETLIKERYIQEAQIAESDREETFAAYGLPQVSVIAYQTNLTSAGATINLYFVIKNTGGAPLVNRIEIYATVYKKDTTTKVGTGKDTITLSSPLQPGETVSDVISVGSFDTTEAGGELKKFDTKITITYYSEEGKEFVESETVRNMVVY